MRPIRRWWTEWMFRRLGAVLAWLFISLPASPGLKAASLRKRLSGDDYDIGNYIVGVAFWLLILAATLLFV